jgi:hypothetical protein
VRGWNETVLHRFLDRPGDQFIAGLALDATGNYGTTSGDLTTTFGSGFEITPLGWQFPGRGAQTI